MKRRQSITLFAASVGIALAGLSGLATAQDAPKSIRIGYSLAKTGPNAPGGETTVRPNYEMWVKEVNAAGGLMLKAYGKRVPLEVVEYDDRSSTEEAVRAIERLISQDKVDIILPPWGTAVNLAVAPLLARHGYPQLGSTSLTDKSAEFAKRWPTIFFMLGAGGDYAESLMTQLEAARKAGKIGDKVAMLHVADGFGVDAAVAARKAAAVHGFKLVVDKSYPIGSQDLSTLLNEVKAQAPDV
jgi:branched-chain amino acid transport system substrate-binding protein